MKTTVSSLLTGLFALVVLALGTYGAWQLSRDSLDPPTGTEDLSSEMDENLVRLTPESFARTAIETERAKRIDLAPMRTISGRLDYKQDQHIAVKSVTAGVITHINVKPGDAVSAGDVLARVSCPEVGRIRAEIKDRQSSVELARKEHAWQSSICAGVDKLAKLIDEDQDPEMICQSLSQELLGDYRESLMASYTRYRLALTMQSNLLGAADTGAVAGRVLQERESEWQSAKSALIASKEQSLFATRLQCDASGAKLESAERQLTVSREQLSALLGPAAVANNDGGLASEGESLSEFAILSPINGTVEERLLSTAERVAAGEAIFTIADTSQLWAVAEIRERDWQTMEVELGQMVEVTSPVIPGAIFGAKIVIVGRRVNIATGAAPLIAELSAEDARLKPGVFVRMSVPSGAVRPAIVVSEASVVVHDGQHFVFVPAGEFAYRRVNVEVGVTQAGQLEVLSGLSAGTEVVSTGAFVLKSELLLAGEEE